VIEDEVTGEQLAYNRLTNDLVPLRATADGQYRHTGASDGFSVYELIGQSTSQALTTAVMVANEFRGLVFDAPAWLATLDRLIIEVTAAAGANGRVWVYECKSRGTLYPGALVLDSGDLSTAGTGVKTWSGSQALKPGLSYIVGAIFDGAPTMRALSAAALKPRFGIPVTVGATLNSYVSKTGMTYGAAPNPFPAGAVLSVAAGFPAIGARLLTATP